MCCINTTDNNRDKDLWHNGNLLESVCSIVIHNQRVDTLSNNGNETYAVHNMQHCFSLSLYYCIAIVLMHIESEC